MQQPKGAETGQGVAQAGEPGEKLRIGDRQQASDQRRHDEYWRYVCRKKTFAAKNTRGMQVRVLLGEQKRQQARIVEESSSYIKVVEDQNGEGNERDARYRKRRDPRPGDPPRDTDGGRGSRRLRLGRVRDGATEVANYRWSVPDGANQAVEHRRTRFGILQLAGYVGEGSGDAVADRCESGDGRNCDQGGNQPIFDRRNTGLVPDQLCKTRAHWVLLEVQSRAGCREKFDKPLSRKKRRLRIARI